MYYVELPSCDDAKYGRHSFVPLLAAAVALASSIVAWYSFSAAAPFFFSMGNQQAALHPVSTSTTPRGGLLTKMSPNWARLAYSAKQSGSASTASRAGTSLLATLGSDPDGPQQKAASFMLRLVTWASAQEVLAELDGLGNEGDLVVAPHSVRMQDQDYAALVNTIEKQPLGDGDSWIRALAAESPRIAIRVIEKREAVHKRFDYHMLAHNAAAKVSDSNRELFIDAVRIAAGNPQLAETESVEKKAGH